jgi:hypothetical protein
VHDITAHATKFIQKPISIPRRQIHQAITGTCKQSHSVTAVLSDTYMIQISNASVTDILIYSNSDVMKKPLQIKKGKKSLIPFSASLHYTESFTLINFIQKGRNSIFSFNQSNSTFITHLLRLLPSGYNAC